MTSYRHARSLTSYTSMFLVIFGFTLLSGLQGGITMRVKVTGGLLAGGGLIGMWFPLAENSRTFRCLQVASLVCINFALYSVVRPRSHRVFALDPTEVGQQNVVCGVGLFLSTCVVLLHLSDLLSSPVAQSLHLTSVTVQAITIPSSPKSWVVVDLDKSAPYSRSCSPSKHDAIDNE
ncbi:hypothetical protein DIPPA_17509 [Diplonema papillatum]|nr:hypothetical protein DIPPA_17509 [Diplonema papillatum]|eukprot:gene16632-25511_t